MQFRRTTCFPLQEEFKYVYSFLNVIPHIKEWSKLIWSLTIPPSNSTLIWRIFHHWMPIDDNFARIGCHFSIMCNLCKSTIKSDHHLIIECPFLLSYGIGFKPPYIMQWISLGSPIQTHDFYKYLNPEIKKEIQFIMHNMIYKTSYHPCVNLLYHHNNPKNLWQLYM